MVSFAVQKLVSLFRSHLFVFVFISAGGVMQSLTGKLKSHMLWGCSQTLKKKKNLHI